MLKRIEIHNYKCFVDFSLDLPGLCLFVGSNGSGKSSLWQVLAGLQDVIARGEEVTKAFPTTTLTKWRKDSPSQRYAMTVLIGEDEFHYELVLTIDTERQQSSILRESLACRGETIYFNLGGNVEIQRDKGEPPLRFLFNRKRSFLPDIELEHDNRQALAFRESMADLVLFAPDPHQVESKTTSDAHWLDRNGKNFAFWLRGVLAERPEVIVPMLKDLRPAMPGLERIGLESISKTVRELVLTFRALDIEYKLSIDELSDGQRMLLLLHGFLHGAIKDNITVFLDEPETGLAPHEMQPWISAMAQAIENHGGQALVISHHPEVINYVAAAHTIQFRRPRGEAVVTHEVTLETTGGMRVSEWLSQPWIYEDEDEKPIQ